MFLEPKQLYGKRLQCNIIFIFLYFSLSIISSVSAEKEDTVSHQKPNEQLVKAEQLGQSARHATQKRKYTLALADLQSALKLLQGDQELTSQRQRAILQCQLGAVYIEQGQWSKAEKNLLACLEAARSLDESQLVGEALVKLGQNAFKKGQFELANTHLQEAVTVTTAIDDLPRLAFARLWLGAVAALNENFEQAEYELLEAVAVARNTDDKSTEGRARNILGENARLHGQYDAAIAHYQQALSIYESINNGFGMTMVIHNLGHVTTMMGDTETALQYYDRSLAMAMEINAIPAALEILAALAAIAANAGDTDRALHLLGLVYANSAAPKEALHMFADPVLARLQKDLPAKVIESGLARGRTLNFDEAVQEILAKNK